MLNFVTALRSLLTCGSPFIFIMGNLNGLESGSTTSNIDTRKASSSVVLGGNEAQNDLTRAMHLQDASLLSYCLMSLENLSVKTSKYRLLCRMESNKCVMLR
uniref:Secreted protein n=1 Tax=Ascaris lumbricoides TaxID=6252 RepID=A0A0M3HU07_ASCLU